MMSDSNTNPALRNATLEFLDKFHKAGPVASNVASEEQLKNPVTGLLTQVGEIFKKNIQVYPETILKEYKLRPDLGVHIEGLPCGYIELKAPGKGANPKKFVIKHDKEQWTKLANLPNVILTDGLEWGLYSNGELIGEIISFPEDNNSLSPENLFSIERMFLAFLNWEPHVPQNPKDLARFIAPLTKFLRDEVNIALLNEKSNISDLKQEWQTYFFPNADNEQFSDAYAQTVTYALLLARLAGATNLEPDKAAKTLGEQDNLLGHALRILAQEAAQDDIKIGFTMLRRCFETLNLSDFQTNPSELWLYFYEDFLGEYDKKLKENHGVYYTPRECVELQVRLSSELLEKRFGKKLGFADDGVMFLDPATGTGTYLVSIIQYALKKVKAKYGDGAVPERATVLAQNMHGFEILIGPYAVAKLRLSQTLKGLDADLAGRLNIFLADTLEDPGEGSYTKSLTHQPLTEERKAAQKVKNDGEIIVCIGNPPYHRQNEKRASGDEYQQSGGWVRFGRAGQVNNRPIFNDFSDVVEKKDRKHLKNIYNDYVYFWRWALWRLFDKQQCGGIVNFITASSYLSGPGFIGMRKFMRQVFDEIYIIDLGGETDGTRKTSNIFNIKRPVAICIGITKGIAKTDNPAKTYYTKINAESKGDKLQKLNEKILLKDFDWMQCTGDWTSTFIPQDDSSFFQWPKITDIMPWSHSGAQFKATWPIAESSSTLKKRWQDLLSVRNLAREEKFAGAGDKTISFTSKQKNMPGYGEPSIEQLTIDDKIPKIIEYGYRPFDRAVAIADARVNYSLRPDLYNALSSDNIFFTSLMSHPLGKGPGILCFNCLPDMHNFRGSFGGKDVMPLYRDATKDNPNINHKLLEKLSKHFNQILTAEDIAAYCYAILTNRNFVERYWDELDRRKPVRIPITKDKKLFNQGVKLGKKLIWLHTFGTRFSTAITGNKKLDGVAKCIVAISGGETQYPESFEYKPTAKEVHIGRGRFGPISPEVWNYAVSDYQVVKKWLEFRMKNRKGRKSSPLDEVRPDKWTATMTKQFLEILWVLEHTIAMEVKLNNLLEKILAESIFTMDDLPHPIQEEINSPSENKTAARQVEMGI